MGVQSRSFTDQHVVWIYVWHECYLLHYKHNQLYAISVQLENNTVNEIYFYRWFRKFPTDSGFYRWSSETRVPSLINTLTKYLKTLRDFKFLYTLYITMVVKI